LLDITRVTFVFELLKAVAVKEVIMGSSMAKAVVVS